MGRDVADLCPELAVGHRPVGAPHEETPGQAADRQIAQVDRSKNRFISGNVN
jgi:hypothetical protein